MENYTFYPGQKVVCIISEWWSPNGPNDGSIRMPRKDEVLTVHAVHHLSEGVFLQFDGMDMASAWRSMNFRPLDTLTEQVERIEKEGAPLELETA